MEITGSDVVVYLNGHETVRDGTLVSLHVRHIGTEPIITLIFEISHTVGVRVVELELRDIQEFEYSYNRESPPIVIEFLKCLMTESGDFYLSLDPYDEREAFISDKDNDFFIEICEVDNALFSTLKLCAADNDPMSRRKNLAYPNASMAYTYSDASDPLTLNHTIAGTGTVPNYTLGFTAAHQLNSEVSSQSSYVSLPKTHLDRIESLR